mmetsp:Transcript_13249/g.24671  ORF Transcript_13249/g.24671 Transcript_13249/m.24671 type:complete len:109 (+) Transcript_13249:333-659(+)
MENHSHQQRPALSVTMTAVVTTTPTTIKTFASTVGATTKFAPPPIPPAVPLSSPAAPSGAGVSLHVPPPFSFSKPRRICSLRRRNLHHRRHPGAADRGDVNDIAAGTG